MLNAFNDVLFVIFVPPHKTIYEKMNMLNMIARVGLIMIAMWMGQCEHNSNSRWCVPKWYQPSERSLWIQATSVWSPE